MRDLWALVVDVWQHGYMGFDVGHMLLAVIIILLFVGLRGLFSRFIINRLMKLAHKTPTDVDVKLLESLQKPLGLVPVIIGLFLATEVVSLDADMAAQVTLLIRSLIVICLFWSLYNAVEPFSFLFSKLEAIFTEVMVEWVVKTLKLAFALLGLAAVLELWGIQVAPLLASLGLLGVAVALGAQDLFKNLIAGILVIAEKRFHRGDWIKVDGVVEGTVENINFRSTLVRRFDKAPVYVPNAKLSDNAVTNFTAMTHRRIYWKIGVIYDTSVDQLKAIRDGIESYVLENDDFAHPPEVATFVRIDAFNDSSIDIMLYCFTKTTNWGEWLEIKEQLAYRVKEIVLGAGSDFAFPSQTVYLETSGADAPEVFQAPKGKKTSAT